VRLKKTILPPGGKELAGSSVKAEDCGRGDGVRFVGSPGILCAMKDEDMIVRVDSDSGNLAQDETGRKLWPTVDDGVWLSGAGLLGWVRLPRWRERGNRNK
jgi:hypothetical protein